MGSKNSDEQGSESIMQDLEIKDANLIFNHVWTGLVTEKGEVQLRFPKEIFWLNGAPGAGKGTHTSFIMQYRDFSGTPIIISDLLKSEEAKRRIDAGILAGDREVFEILLHKLLDPCYANGAIVDGFPRTLVQVECLKLFYNKLSQLRNALVDTPNSQGIGKPNFHIIVLYIDEAESIHRQIKRGQQALVHNKEVEETGIGQVIEIRKTDLEEETARNRYRTFKEKTYSALQSLQEVFHYHFINAHGSIEEIQKKIIGELKYQSSLELNENTFDRLNTIPLSSQLAKHARQQLIYRLDDYEANHTSLLKRVIKIIEKKFMPIIYKHSISGRAQVSSEDPIFMEPLALPMLIDIFSERGFHITVDVRYEEIPVSVDRETFEIKTRHKRVCRVEFRFKGSEIRRGS